MAETQQPSTPSTSTTKAGVKPPQCNIVPYPKVVFFYPLMLASIGCGIAQAISGPDTPSPTAGTIFAIAFLINILIISFDFPGVKALALAFAIIAFVFGLLWLNAYYEYKLFGPIKEYLKLVSLHLHASTALYFIVAAILCAMIMGGIFTNFLWNRWTMEPNRLKHSRGIPGLADVQEYPVIDLQVSKQIDDVFEYLLLGSGTLTFSIPNSNPIRLENVPFISVKERRIQDIIRKFSVTTH
jgi:hypothetical protein